MVPNRGVWRVGLVLVGLALLAGCRPSPANIKLRKEKQELQQRVSQLEREQAADRARLRAMEGSTTRPTISQSDIERLYTAHGLRFGRLTGGYRDPSQQGPDEGIVVHVVPTDQDEQTLKAAGSFRISVFDLSQAERPLLGQRAFSLEEARQAWHGRALLFNYVLKVPFTQTPKQEEVLVRVEFTDELTGRTLTGEQKARVKLQ